MNRSEILKVADTLINGERASVYGDARKNHEQIAKMWSALLGTEVSTEQVFMCLIAMKLSRLTSTPNHEDSWVDICGYAALAGEDEEV
jgi:hypothetical protein